MPHHMDQQGDELSWVKQGSPQEIADILTDFANELRSGRVNVWNLKRELQLNADAPIEMQVQANVDDDGREGLHMKLHWNVAGSTPDLSKEMGRNAVGGVNG